MMDNPEQKSNDMIPEETNLVKNSESNVIMTSETNSSEFNNALDKHNIFATREGFNDDFQALAEAFSVANSVLDNTPHEDKVTPDPGPAIFSAPPTVMDAVTTPIDTPIPEIANATNTELGTIPEIIDMIPVDAPAPVGIPELSAEETGLGLPVAVETVNEPIIFNETVDETPTGITETPIEEPTVTEPISAETVSFNEIAEAPLDIPVFPVEETGLDVPVTEPTPNELVAEPITVNEIVENDNGIAQENLNPDGQNDVQSTAEQEVTNEQLETSGNPSDVDYFHYQFSEKEKAAGPLLRPTESVTIEPQLETFDVPVAMDIPTNDNLFSDTIRPQEVPQEYKDNRVEITKIFMPKEEELQTEVAPVVQMQQPEEKIHIDEEGGKDFRFQKAMIQFTLYSFYVIIIVCVAIFGYSWYQNHRGFDLSRTEITLALGSSFSPSIFRNSKVESNLDYIWTSQDTSIVTVDGEGNITAVGSGETKIIVKSKKSGKMKEILVNALSILVEDMRFSKKKIDLKVGDYTILSPIINGNEDIVISLVWESSNTSVATVDSNGYVQAVGAGTATIIAIEEESGLAAEITISVTAKKGNSNSNTNTNQQNAAVTGVSLNKTSVNLTVGDSTTVTATVRPAKAGNKAVTWSSNNTAVAKVENGKITALKEGKATITVTTKEGNKKASVTVTVSAKTSGSVPVQSVSVSPKSTSLDIGQTTTLNYTISPSGATNKNVTWSSSDASVASVNNRGEVTAHKAGTVTITATTNDGNKQDTATVEVKAANVPATDVNLNESSLSLQVDDEFPLVATVLPGNATNKTVSWSSSDIGVATVSANGRVKAISEGTATITVTTHNGKTATCVVTVSS